MQMECMSCGKHVLAENQQYHIKTSHDNKNVKFKIVNDAKQLKLMWQVLIEELQLDSRQLAHSVHILHIEREYVNKVLKEDMEEMIDTFGKRSGRNKCFFK